MWLRISCFIAFYQAYMATITVVALELFMIQYYSGRNIILTDYHYVRFLGILTSNI